MSRSREPQWAKNNDKLRIQLARKSHELEIEAALEKVRVVVMKMNEPGDLLRVCQTLYKQFVLLGFSEIRNAMINIHNDADQSFVNYDYSDEIGKSTNHLTYDIHPLVKKQIKKIRSATNAFSETHFTGSDLAKWKRFRKKIGEKDDPRLKKGKGLYYYFYSIGTGSIGISTFGPIAKEKLAILKRFRNVFVLSYQRYIDISKAETQAREAEIELALERVRARTMAMQKSEELKETTLVLFQQFKALGATPAQVSICIFDEQAKMGEMFATLKGQKIDRSFPMELDKERFVMKKAKKAFLDKQRTFSCTIAGKELQDYNRWRNSLVGRKGWNEADSVRKRAWHVNAVFFSRGMMGVSSEIPASDEMKKLLGRFARVFDLTYTRFLDLQKAEAQAREAEIELALERVRARTMAMQKSDELQEVVRSVFERLNELKIELTTAIIIIFSEGSRDCTWWLVNKMNQQHSRILVKYAELPYFRGLFEAKESGKEIFSACYSGKQKKDFYHHLLDHTDFKHIPEHQKQFLLEQEFASISVALTKNTGIHLTRYFKKSFSEEENETLTRFARVFEQAYTRFLDLQKAEVQAMEARIEAALERVRSRTMAMHQTSELQEVIHTVHDELLHLNLSIDGGSFVVINQDVGPELRCWGSGGTASTSEEVRVPHFNMPFCMNLMTGIKKGPGFFTEEFSQKDKKEYFRKLFKHKPWSDLSSEQKKITLSSAGGYTRSVAVSKHTSIFIINHQGREFTEAENDILKRFAKVFEQTYTRFLDLQNAEAQAREAQIEAALERVRSRTMGMQKSEELKEVIQLVYQQFLHLKINVEHTGFILDYKERDDLHIWLADQHLVPSEVTIPSFDSPPNNAIREAKEKGQDYFEYLLSFEEKNKFYRDLFKIIPDVPEESLAYYFNCPGLAGSGVLLDNIGLYIENFSGTAYSDEENGILMRFGKVFQQTYTRFLDLQKAEAQAREAQIEAALERVRSRTMAMHHSEEIADIAGKIFGELSSLDLVLNRVLIWIFNDEERYITWWSANPEIESKAESYRIDYNDQPVFLSYFQAWQSRTPLHLYTLTGDAKKKWEDHLFNHTELSKLPMEVRRGMREEGTIFTTSSISQYGLMMVGSFEPLSNENIDIIQRFGRVFQQSYTRYLDVEKAEAQAREAQIEAALERVRAASMAMHKSEELKDVALVVLNQFEFLGIPVLGGGITITNHEKGTYVSYFVDTNVEGDKLIVQTRELRSKEFWLARMMGKHTDLGEQEITLKAGERKIREWIEFIRVNHSEERAAKVEKAHLKTVYFHLLSYHPEATIITSSIAELSEESRSVMRRLGKTFAMSYKRFEDIKKAEAQAREAQIEVALERVRSRTMAMHSSSELIQTAELLFDQLKQLGAELQGVAFSICDENSVMVQKWTSIGVFSVPYTIEPGEQRMYEAWKNQAGIYEEVYEGERQKKYYELFMEVPAFKEGLQKFIESGHPIPTWQKNHAITFKYGYLLFITTKPFNETQIFLRFGKVFEQTYTRFLDLQKAEAQAYEAMLEASLERIRSRSLAMHNSGELSEVSNLLFKELFGFSNELKASGIVLCDREVPEQWMCSADLKMLPAVHIPKDIDPPIYNLYKAWETRQELFCETLNNEEAIRHTEALLSLPEIRAIFDSTPQSQIVVPQAQTNYAAAFKQGYLLMISEFPVEGSSVFPRFAKVFEQAYTRFLDLQKAEAQAREAEIELGLERVRARAMAMQRSGELSDLVDTVFKELTKLDFALKWCIINIIDEPSLTNTVWAANPDIEKAPESYHMKFEDYPFHHAMMKGYKERSTKYVYVIEGEEKKIYDEYLFNETEFRRVPAAAQAASRAMARYVVTFSFSNFGGLQTVGDQPLTEASLDILSRFGKVFDLTYTRFNDLRTAETQAREAQIEASLERVRSKTMAMHNSHDVAETVAAMFDELVKLGITTLRCGILIGDENNQMEVWTAKSNNDGKADLIVGRLDMTIHPLLLGIYQAWRDKRSSYSYEMIGDDLREYYKAINNTKHYPVRFDVESMPQHQFHNDFFFNEGSLFAFSAEQLSPEASQIFKRFAGVFGQTYRRFLDLQKAEAQTRESQIQLALERVRARTMAMQRSEELSETAQILFQQFAELGESPIQITIGIINEPASVIEFSVTDWAGSGAKVNQRFNVDIHEPTLINKMYRAWKEQQKSLVVDLSGEELQKWLDYRNTISGITVTSGDTKGRRVITNAFFSKGHVSFSTPEPRPPETVEILERFAGVFDLTYTRFLDLKNAEAQAREAQIEAAMEKVRARAMAMQKPNELLDVARLLRVEMGLLGVEELETSSIYIVDEEKQIAECWYAIKDIGEENKKFVSDEMILDLPATWVGREMWKFYRSKQKKTSIVMKGENRREWINYCASKSNVLQGFWGDEIPERTYHLLKFSNGYMGAASPGDISVESWDVLQRATAVFSLAYTRFRDLQLAEAQAREATIEAALERVRGKAMAMHNSADLSSAASMVFTELRKLGISPIRCGVGLLNHESLKAPLYSATSSAEGDSLSLVGWVLLSGHPVLENIYQSWQNKEDYFPELSGEELKSYYEHLMAGLSLPSVPDWQQGQRQFGHFIPFAVGCLYAWSETPYNEAEIKILKRFATIIDLTFRRYMELQQSEANARDAVKQAALDRIRADIASMRTVSDLDRITPLIWNELTILGIPFIRCGVFIMDEAQRLIHTFLSTPDGQAIGAFHIPYDTPGNIRKVLSHWHEKKNYIDHWGETAFTEFAATLVKQGALASPEQYLKTIPHGGFHLHFLPFLQGMLYVGNTTRLNKDEIGLIQSVADAFSTAYARYEDFNKLEAAKQQVEKTVVDLKQAQQQLVQSEKMASLGELTAGIAHEIQNPLNFVNNFSDVSNELLDEMMEELAKGNKEEAAAIAEDVRQNLEKILHHGKRADAIVKGMLQHSRTSSGQKEMIDINMLADEYLRLAYHGLRAKDKSFSAKFETDFDKSIGTINVIPQEMGRVILNLINNAFYAVTEKKKHTPAAQPFEPTVTVSTARSNGKVEVKVRDNGDGIPPRVLDKIFQPFFTTKPSGQGTGLGLSLAYDIVTKGHGGELGVETKEGEGSEFVIKLPIM